ncbi:MAG: PD-(D/E)XK nuclease family protein [Trueperaceae bacterium]|nr:PD-(D/E)XK nuclease family protein [Trueperaceae bacterium]
MKTTEVDDVTRFESLLEEFGRIRGASATPSTLLEAAGYPSYENVASNLLRYFLDPAEGHGLEGLFLEALTEPLGFEGVSVLGVEREVGTSSGYRIDLVIDADAHLIGVENKVFAPVYNPMDEYLGHLERKAKGRQVALILLCLHEPQKQVPAGVVVVTYAQLMGRVRRDLGLHAADVPAQYVTFTLDFLKTMENLRKGIRMNPAVLELLKKREDDVLALLRAADSFASENRLKGNELRAHVEELVTAEVSNKLQTRYWRVPGELEGSSVYDIDFQSGAVVAIDAWIGTYGWEVTVFQRRAIGEKLAANELAEWLAERDAPFLVEAGTTALNGSRPVTARFERNAPLDEVATHVANVVRAVAEAETAPGEQPRTALH